MVLAFRASHAALNSALAVGHIPAVRRPPALQPPAQRLGVVHVPESAPAEGIIATAEKQGCDLIVMASHGRRGLGRLVLGSEANEVLAYSKVPALIVR